MLSSVSVNGNNGDTGAAGARTDDNFYNASKTTFSIALLLPTTTTTTTSTDADDDDDGKVYY